VTYFEVSSYVDHRRVGVILANRIVLRCWILPLGWAVSVMSATWRIGLSSQIARTANGRLAPEESRLVRGHRSRCENRARSLRTHLGPLARVEAT
jgi:hypothetical protein